MLHLTDAARQRVSEGIGYYIQEAHLELADGTTVIAISNEDILGDTGFEFEEATSSDGMLDVGGAIIGSMHFTLMNFNDTFTNYDFYGAKITHVRIGIPLGETVEYISKREYTVVESVITEGAVTITAYDAMFLFDKNYSESSLAYPATIRQILEDACTVCSVQSHLPASFLNDSLVIEERPTTDSLTFREVISRCAQIAGCFSKIDNSNALTLGWYDFNNIENDAADFVSVTGIFERNVGTDDTVVTGVRALLKSEEGGKLIPYTCGEEGYVIEFAGNDFITADNAQAIVDSVGAKLIGMRFRKMEVTHLSDPSIEAGDIIRAKNTAQYSPLIVNEKGLHVNEEQLYIAKKPMYYWGIVSSTKFVAGGSQVTRSDSQDPVLNSSTRYSALTQAMQKAREELWQEKTQREIAESNLQREIEESPGLFITEETDSTTGATIYYMHDHPLLADSEIVWKYTAEAFGVSTDGGETYPYGFDVSGDAILNRIYTIGLDAEYITAGTISDRTGNNYWNLDNGTMYIGASAVYMNDGTSVQDEVEDNFTELHRYIRFDGGIITLGEAENPLTLRLQNDRISFYNNINEVAYFDANKMFVKSVEITESAIVTGLTFQETSTSILIDIREV